MAINLSLEDSVLTVFCDNTTFSLKTLNPLDFPAFPEIEADQEAEFPFKVFSSMVKSTAKIVSHDESRAVLTGVLISQEGTTLKMVATDSYRLGVTETQLSSLSANEFEAVIQGLSYKILQHYHHQMSQLLLHLMRIKLLSRIKIQPLLIVVLRARSLIIDSLLVMNIKRV